MPKIERHWHDMFWGRSDWSLIKLSDELCGCKNLAPLIVMAEQVQTCRQIRRNRKTPNTFRVINTPSFHPGNFGSLPVKNHLFAEKHVKKYEIITPDFSVIVCQINRMRCDMPQSRALKEFDTGCVNQETIEVESVQIVDERPIIQKGLNFVFRKIEHKTLPER